MVSLDLSTNFQGADDSPRPGLIRNLLSGFGAGLQTCRRQSL